jgi:hypothetical protein
MHIQVGEFVCHILLCRREGYCLLRPKGLKGVTLLCTGGHLEASVYASSELNAGARFGIILGWSLNPVACMHALQKEDTPR